MRNTRSDSGPPRVSPQRLAVLVTALLLGAWPAESTGAASPAPRTVAAIEEEWQSTVGALVRRCEANGLAELTKWIGEWAVPEEIDRQHVLAVPDRDMRPDWIDTPQEEAIWRDFRTARRARAAATLAWAREAARTASRPALRDDSPTFRGMSEPIRLLYRALRDDPDDERAREAAGWVKKQGTWVWPETAQRVEQAEEYSAEFGWMPRGRQERYRQGERYERGRWIRFDPADSPGLSEEWRFVSDHWIITSNAGPKPAALLAQHLEFTYVVWRQVFGGFQFEPREWEQRLGGRARPPVGGRKVTFAARLAADRRDYVAALEPLEPAIGRTLGIYWMPTRTAWFFAGEGQESTTVHHEATHQLFAEMRRTSPLAGERCGFWAIEAAACYLESVQPTAFGWTVGGRDAGRAPAARERLLEDEFHVPLAELAALGRREFQSDERLPQIYSEISGLADFFMNGERARYRDAFVEYLTRIYTGTVDADTLARLCGRTYEELDNAYRRHMSR